MKKGLLFVMMMLLAACGGGGGGGATVQNGPTGVLQVGFDKTSAKVLASVAEPQFVRIMVRQKGIDHKDFFVKKDVAIGTASVDLVLPAGSGYTIEAVSYALTGSRHIMLQYAAGLANDPDGYTVTGNATTTAVNMALAPIEVPGVVVNPGTIDVNSPYSAHATVTDPALQDAWSVAVLASNSLIPTHLATPPAMDLAGGPHDTLKAPLVSSVIIWGEFFINPNLIDSKTENTSDWSIFSANGLPVTVSGVTTGGTFNNLFADTVKPHVNGFSVDSAVQTSATFTGFKISATDNSGTVSGYKITNVFTIDPVTKAHVPTRPVVAGGLADSIDWVATTVPPTTLTFTIASGLTQGGSQEIWAWAKDAHGNVSEAFAPVKVTFEDRPIITSAVTPSGVLLQNASIALTISATLTPTEYYISDNPIILPKDDVTGIAAHADLSTPSGGSWLSWVNGAIPRTATVNYLSYPSKSGALVPSNATSIPLYIWVKNDKGISPQALVTSFSIGQSPQIITTDILGTATSTKVTIASAIDFAAYAGKTVNGYKFTSTPTKSELGWTAIAVAHLDEGAQYDYVGALTLGQSTKNIYLWVKDNTGLTGMKVIPVVFTITK